MPGEADHSGSALGYHQRTKHTEARLRQMPHELDWANQPSPFKIYEGVETVGLAADPAILTGATAPALAAIGASPEAWQKPHGDVVPDLATLTRVLYLSAGITKRKVLPGGGEHYFRAYPNTGALYHVDVYLVTGDLAELAAGVYHFGPEDFSLHRLRRGDHRSRLVEATGGQRRIAEAPVILATASSYWRNAWKYRERAYRHCFWDAGTLHANLLAVAGGRSDGRGDALAPGVVMGFADGVVEALLGLDPEREGVLSLVPLGRTGTPPPSPPPLEPIEGFVRRPTGSPVHYPAITQAHAASSLRDGAAAAAWRAASEAPWQLPAVARPAAEGRVELAPLPRSAGPDLAHVIRRRGSTRAFDPARPVSFDALSAALRAATAGIPADFLVPGGTLLELYLIVNAVTGLTPGLYRHHREDQTLQPLAAGDFRRRAGRLALGQALAADAAVDVYSVCDLEAVVDRLGDRGYRAAQLEGGITGGRLYLAAYAQGLGATGLTFFDDEVIELFSPAAAGRSVMFLTAIGRADRAALGLRGS